MYPTLRALGAPDRARRRTATRTLPTTVGALAIIACVAGTAHASPGQEVISLRDTDASSLGQTLAGTGVTVSSAEFTGIDVQAGAFSGLAFDAISPSRGVVLSTGSVIAADPAATSDTDFSASAVTGPNSKLTTTGDLGGAGSALLDQLFGSTTYDAATLTLEVVPAGEDLHLQYVFGSEEYAGWSDQNFGDAFAIRVGDTTCSVVPGTDIPVGTGSVNAGANTSLFVANFAAGDPKGGQYDTEMNAFTKPLTCDAEVSAGTPVTVTIALGDTRDGQLDSSVLLAAGSLTSTPLGGGEEPTPTSPATNTPGGGTVPATNTGGGTTNEGSASQADAGDLAQTGAGIGLAVTSAVILVIGGTGVWLLARRARRAAPTTSTD